MNIAGIICEYNPFHLGHQWQINQTKAAGATHIVAVMSGCFVQRGEPALWDKWTRTRTALANGADLVIELPVPYATATAQKFATGAVNILNSLGCVNTLSFGSELGEIQPLLTAVTALENPAVQWEIKKQLSTGITYAAARQKAIEVIYGNDISQLLTHPNNILGVEYLLALSSINSPITPITIKRKGATHDSQNLGEFASASALRNLLINNKENEILPYIPENSHQLLLSAYKQGSCPNPDLYNRSLLTILRRTTPEQLANLPDISEGLENRLYKSIQQSNSIDQLLNNLKTKRYSHARLRRILLSAWLGIDKTLASSPPPYIRILGTRSKGKEILTTARKTATIPLSHSFATLQQIDHLLPYIQLERTADDMYGTITNNVQPCGKDYGKFIVHNQT